MNRKARIGVITRSFCSKPRRANETLLRPMHGVISLSQRQLTQEVQVHLSSGRINSLVPTK